MEMLTPSRLVQRHLDDVLTNLTDAFDGDVDSVHQARIATRRLREVLPLIDMPELEHVTANVRAAGRHLGRVRELDVMSSLLDSMSDRVPTSAATELHTLRRSLHHRLNDARRDMVKEIERLDLWTLRDTFAPSVASRLWRWVPPAAYVVTPKWHDAIWTRIVERSNDAVSSAQRAPAVYLPNRTHRARIAVKKLRYAVEVASDIGVWRPQRLLKDLRKIQGILGNVHDVQVLADLAAESASGEHAAPDGQTLIKELLDAEIGRHVAEYAKRRERIFQIADVCARAASKAKWRIPRPLVAGAVLTAPLLIESIIVRPARHVVVTPATHRRHTRR